MIRWADKLYLGEGMEKEQEKLKKKLEKNKPVFGIFLITAPSCQENLLDVLDTKDCLFPYYRRRNLLVYGMAKSREEAITLTVRILEDVYQETGELKVGEYFEKG